MDIDAFAHFLDEVKTTVLTDWYVLPVKDFIGVCVTGHRLNDPPYQEWHSSVITRRLTAWKLSTNTNSIYILDGPLNYSSACREAEFSPRMGRLFKNGFPVHWKKKTEEYLRIKKEQCEKQQLSEVEISPFMTMLDDRKAFISETQTAPSTHCVEPARQEARIGPIHSKEKSPSHDKFLNHVGWSPLCKEMEVKLPEQTFVKNRKNQSNMNSKVHSKFLQQQKSTQGVTEMRSKRSCKQTCDTTSKGNESPKSPVKLSEHLMSKTLSVEENTHKKPSLPEKDAIDHGLYVVLTPHCTTNDIQQKCKNYNLTVSGTTTEPRHAILESGLPQNQPPTDSGSKQNEKDSFDPLHNMNCMTNDEQKELKKENDKYVYICSENEKSPEHVMMTRSRKKQLQQIDPPDHVDYIPSNGTDKMHVRNTKRKMMKAVDQKNDQNTGQLKEIDQLRQLKDHRKCQHEFIPFTKTNIVNDSNSSKSHGNNRIISVKNNIQRKVHSVGRSKHQQHLMSKCSRGVLDEDDKGNDADVHQDTAKGDQDHVVPWAKKELEGLKKAVQAVPTDVLKPWEQGTSLANGRATMKWQQNIVFKAKTPKKKPKGPEKKKPRLTKSTKKMASGGTEKAQLVQTTTRVGTRKRKHEVRSYLDPLSREDFDDPFHACITPIYKVKKFFVSQSHLQQLKQKDKPDEMLMFMSPYDKNSTTPDFQYHVTPIRRNSTGILSVPDRRQAFKAQDHTSRGQRAVGRRIRKQRLVNKCSRIVLNEDDKQDHADVQQDSAKGDQEQVVPWTQKELKVLNKGVQAVPTNVPENWEKVASLANTAKECQENLVCQEKTPMKKYKSPKKKKPMLTKSTKKMASGGTEKEKLMQITARVGTLKRKHEVREYLDSIHREDCDDPFDCSATPIRKTKKFVVSHLQRLKQKDKPDEVLMLKSPFGQNSTTPDVHHHVTPISKDISPGMLNVPDRKVTDHYVYRLENRKTCSQWGTINSKLVRKKGQMFKKCNTDCNIFQPKENLEFAEGVEFDVGRKMESEDDDDEKDDYFSD
uniref:mis18-binding protein 1 isoform X2 n=1 Tax=Myxine glutinosa TaxID=7769 RepID=UPI00358E7C54